jgi:alpha-beta hydrolase superfamily lysophospholipase
MAERVVFTTQDGVEIVGAYRAAGRPLGAALLLHMMPATKESWDAFAALLQERGISSLAIDLRGHGESVRRGAERLDYKAFTDADQQAKRLDAEAASAWLAGREGASPKLVVGASIGANLAIRYAASHPETRACLALSPGLDYRGVTTEEAVRGLAAGQGLMLAASEEDEYAFASMQSLMSVGSAAERLTRDLRGAGHGTAMFDRDPAFMREAADWLASRLV